MSSVGKAGLEDVVVSTSDICFIDGREGRLVYRGYNVDDLAAQSNFEEVVYLLWHGALPSKKEYETFNKALSSTANRKLPTGLVALLRTLPKKTTPMEVLRTGVSALSSWDPDAADNSRPSRSLTTNAGAAAGLRKKRSGTRSPAVAASAVSPAPFGRPSNCRAKRAAAHVSRTAPMTATRRSARRGVTQSSVS